MPAAPAAGADPTGCSFASGSIGDFAETICWIDFSDYNQTAALSANGQDFVLGLPGGYTITFTLTERHVLGAEDYVIRPAASWVVDHPEVTSRSAWANRYITAGGEPILWNWNGVDNPIHSEVAWRLNDIVVLGPDDQPIDDFAFVVGDAEHTAQDESVGFRADTELTLIEEQLSPLQLSDPTFIAGCRNIDPATQDNLPHMGGDMRWINVNKGLTWGAGNLLEASTPDPSDRTRVQCRGIGPTAFVPGGGSNLLFAAQSPGFIETSIVSQTRNSSVFGVMMASARVTKVIEGERVASGDSFDLAVTSGASTLATASTGAAAATATTGIVPIMAGSGVRLAESATAASGTDLDAYQASWSCTLDGAAVPFGNGLSVSGDGLAVVAAADFVPLGGVLDCTVTNSIRPPAPPVPAALPDTGGAGPAPLALAALVLLLSGAGVLLRLRMRRA